MNATPTAVFTMTTTPTITSRAAHYLERARNFKPSRWASIKITELARTLTSADIEDLLPLVHEVAVAKAHARLEQLNTMDGVPPILISIASKQLAKAQRGQSEIEAALRRTLAKEVK